MTRVVLLQEGEMVSSSNKHAVLLLDGDPASRKNISFLLQIALYRAHVFEQLDECLNWFDAFSPQADDALCLVVNGEVGREAIGSVIREVEARSRALPILVIDRTRAFRSKKEILGSLFTDLPVYVGAAEEIMDFLKIFAVLKGALEARERTFRGLFDRKRGCAEEKNHG